MPESVRDRLNCRHELLFLLVKQSAYWFDLDPIRIPHMTAQPGPGHHASHTVSARQSPPAPPGRTGPEPSAQVRPACPRDRRRTPLQQRAEPARPPQRPQPRRRLVHPHPALRRTALRRVPHRTPAPLHRGRMQTGWHRPGHVHRFRHYRPGRHPARPTIHWHRTIPGVRRPRRRTAGPRSAASPRRRPVMTGQTGTCASLPVTFCRRLISLSRLTPRARLHVRRVNRGAETTARRALTVRTRRWPR